MAEASIGKLALSLTCDSKQLEMAIDKAGSKLKSFSGAVASPIDAMGKLFNAPGKMLGDAVGSISGALKGLPVVGGTLASIIGPDFIGTIRDQAKEMVSTARE